MIKKIGHKTASELRDLSHSEKSVWNKITLTEDGNRNISERFLTKDFIQDMETEIRSVLL